MKNNFDEYIEYKNSIHVKFFEENLTNIVTDNDVLAHLSEIFSNADIYQISESWESVGNDIYCLRFYSVRKNKMVYVHDSVLKSLKSGEDVLFNMIVNPNFNDYSDIVKCGYLDQNPINRYEVRKIEAWGNKEDGYEYNNSFFIGYFDTTANTKNLNVAFRNYLKSKHNIMFKAHKTIIQRDGLCYQIVAQKTLEPLYDFIPVEF